MSTKFNVGMHSEVYILIWIKCGMMIDAVEVYMLTLVYLTLTLIQGHSARKQKPMRQLSYKDCNTLGLNFVCC